MSEQQNNLLQNCNRIEQKAVHDLLDGRWFYIPSYQRGYRWTKTQIYDLCNDLLEYALRKNKNPKAFYSLQPLIVRQAKQTIEGEEKVVYEVIDGQQRLTSINILLRCLMKPAGYNTEMDLKTNIEVDLYHIFYETRPNDYSIFNRLGIGTIHNSDIKDIDMAHIVNAYNYINQWMNNEEANDSECARKTWQTFTTDQYTLKRVADTLIGLLTNEKDANDSKGNAQFLWYEIDAQKDAIQEFLSENKGKIQLTDTEKIRGLFLQRKGKEQANDMIQLSIAKDWELIENTLHRNDFWAFLSSDMSQEDGRINLIFQYIYDHDQKNDKTYTGEDRLFRYYYHKFNNKDSNKEETSVVNEWEKVMEAYRMLQNWYRNPRIYNLIGLLTKEKEISIKTIADLYNLQDVNTTEDFVTKLKQKVCSVIVNKIPISKDGNEALDIKKGDEHINLFYGPKDKPTILSLLRFINVNLLCQQIEQLLEDPKDKASDIRRSNRDELCHIFRFPFDALVVFGWDVEHIDSATTNSLDKKDEQKKWQEEAEQAFGADLTNNPHYIEQKEAYKIADEQGKEKIMSNILKFIRDFIREDDHDDRKNWIGNLTLLDSGTNRMYKNKIFALKREIIRNRINTGIFVPVCTQNVFNKTFNGCTKDNMRWDFNDKKCYHQFILDEINAYKKEYSIK